MAEEDGTPFVRVDEAEDDEDDEAEDDEDEVGVGIDSHCWWEGRARRVESKRWRRGWQE